MGLQRVGQTEQVGTRQIVKFINIFFLMLQKYLHLKSYKNIILISTKSLQKMYVCLAYGYLYSFGMRCDGASENVIEAYKLQEMALPLGPEILIQKL